MQLQQLLTATGILCLVQLNAQPGTPDSSFGVNGKAFTSFSFPAGNIVLQHDNKIVAAGSNSTSIGLIRYRPDGKVDSSFGTNGKLITHLTSQPNSIPFDMGLLVQTDGKIIAGVTDNSVSAYRLIRYFPNGSPDPGFGTNGILTAPPRSGGFYLSALALQNDGKILVAGVSNGFYLARYLPGGTPDDTFGSNGVVSISNSCYPMTLAVSGDGSIIVESIKRALGQTGSADTVVLERFSPQGSKDNSFGNNGFASTGFNQFFYGSLKLLSNGAILAAANAADPYAGPIGIAKYTREGKPDSSFANNGKLVTSMDESEATVKKLLVQKNGSIISAGSILARFSAGGTPDASFATNGKIPFVFASDALLQPDGKIIVFTGPEFTLLRYKGDPTPVPQIHAGGPFTFCQGDSVILSADSARAPYLWSTGDTTRSIIVKQAGSYTVRVTFINGDTATTAPVTITIVPRPARPVIVAGGSTTGVCPGKPLTLTSTVAASYLWNTGATTRSITVNTAGNYAVTVTNAAGCSNTSDTTVVTYRACPKTTALATGNITTNSARLSWAAAPCAVGYRYEIRKKGTTAWLAAHTTAINKIITGLSSATTYQWRVLTACKLSPDTITSAGYTSGPEFTTLAAAVQNGNITARQGGALEAAVYPNPATNRVVITVVHATGKLLVILFDMAGKQVWQSGKTAPTNIALPTQNLAPGAYLVQVSDQKETVVLRMIKE